MAKKKTQKRKKSIAQLEKEKAMLMKKAGLKKARLEDIREQELRRRNLEAEVRALKNPGSAVARKKAKTSALRFGRFLKETANTVANNAVRIRKEREAKLREEKQLELERLRAARRRATKKKK